MAASGEFERLARLAPSLARSSKRVPVGVGDDAAVVRFGDDVDVVICTDTVVEGVHFDSEVSSPDDVGWKAVAVNLSDLAAMGAVPRAAVVGLNRPVTLSEDDIKRLYVGIAQAAARYDLDVVGGDTVTATEWSITVTTLGDMAGVEPVTRGGATVGDVVVLIGQIGAAAAALWAREHGSTPWTHHLSRHRRPRPLVRTGPLLADVGVSAMIDISDGLGADARHICEASNVSMRLDAKSVAAAVAPGVADVVGAGWLSLAVSGGEDFALLITVPAEDWPDLKVRVAAAGEAMAHWIGVVGPAPADDGPRVLLAGSGDHATPIDSLGYDHG